MKTFSLQEESNLMIFIYKVLDYGIKVNLYKLLINFKDKIKIKKVWERSNYLNNRSDSK